MPYIIQGKHGTMISIDVNVKNQLIGAFVENVTCGIQVGVIVRVLKGVYLVSNEILIFVHGKNIFLINWY